MKFIEIIEVENLDIQDVHLYNLSKFASLCYFRSLRFQIFDS